MTQVWVEVVVEVVKLVVVEVVVEVLKMVVVGMTNIVPRSLTLLVPDNIY